MVFGLPLSRSSFDFLVSSFSDVVVRERFASASEAGGPICSFEAHLTSPALSRRASKSKRATCTRPDLSLGDARCLTGHQSRRDRGLLETRLRTIRPDNTRAREGEVKSWRRTAFRQDRRDTPRTTPVDDTAGDSSSSRRKGGRRGTALPRRSGRKKTGAGVPREREIRRRQEGDSLVEISPRRQSSSGHPVPIGEGAPEPPEPLE